jgi:glycosyltransferase involved in cell wall biosynthesis
LSHIESPKLSVVSYCLNSGRFLRETIESVFNQTYDNYEHIIIDGGSTDNTIEILKEYSHLKWISEKEESDNPVLEAIWKGFNIANGEYIIFLAISDGIYDRNWFRKSIEVLDRDKEVSVVWGINQGRSEKGDIIKIAWTEFLEKHPPQKMDWLPFWLSTGHGFESNAVYRRDVFEVCFPKNHPDELYRYFPTLGFNYQLNTRGYLPYFLPMISFYGNAHQGQRQQAYYDLIDSECKIYDRERKLFRKNILSGKIQHFFRDGSSNIIREVSPDELGAYKRKVWRYRVKHKIKRDVQKFLDHI